MCQSTDKVLILEYMDGIRLNDNDSLEAHGVDKQKLVEEITRAYAHQIYIDGFFNGDPHPGNHMRFGKVSVIFSCCIPCSLIHICMDFFFL